jgi:hypothetical protein
MFFKYNIFGSEQSSKKNTFLFFVYLLKPFNSSDYSEERTMKGQLKNNELEMLPNNVVMAQSEVPSCHMPAVTVEKQKNFSPDTWPWG